MPLPLYLRGKCPIVLEAGWTPEAVWTIWKREHFLLYRNSYYDPSVVQPVASRSEREFCIGLHDLVYNLWSCTRMKFQLNLGKYVL
jgi:hypothetical protein